MQLNRSIVDFEQRFEGNFGGIIYSFDAETVLEGFEGEIR